MSAQKLKKALTIILATQMALSPISVAVAETNTNTNKKQDWSNTAAGAMMGVTQLASGMMQTFQQLQQQRQAMGQQMASMQTMANAVPRAGSDEIFKECTILTAEPNDWVEPSICTEGIDPADPNAQMQSQELMSWLNHYKQIRSGYESYNKEGNYTSNQGIGCIRNKVEEMKNALNKRVSEITRITNEIEKAQLAFKKTAQADIDAIQATEALLNGGDTTKAKAILKKNYVEMEKSFDDPACLSVFDQEKMKGFGKKGLIGIQDELSKVTNVRPQGSQFSAADFNDSAIASMKTDIEGLATKLADDIARRGVSPDGITPNLSAYKSAFGIESTGAFNAAVTEATTDINNEIKDLQDDLAVYGISSNDPMLKAAFNPRIDYDQEIANYERDQQNMIFNQAGGKNSIVNEMMSNPVAIYDDGISEDANRQADVTFKTFIQQTLGRTDITVDQKIALIAAEEKKGTNNRFRVNFNKGFYIDDQAVKSYSRISPSQLLAKLADNAKKQYSSNPARSGKTHAQVVAKLKEARNKANSIRELAKGKVKTAIVDRMVNCSNNAIANAKGAGTCGADSLSPASPTFCLKRANSCASNMRSCLKKAQDKVTQVQQTQKTSVDRYTANVQKNKQDLLRIYAQVEGITKLDGLNIEASFQKDFVMPVDLKIDLDKDKKFLPGMEGLEIEDPDTYLALMKDNLKKVQEEIKDQNARILTGKGKGEYNLPSTHPYHDGVLGHLKKVEDNWTATVDKARTFEQQCQTALTNFRAGVKQAQRDANKAFQEQQQKQAELCSRYNAIKNSPVPGCEDVGTLADDMSKVAAFAGSSAAIGQMKAYSNLCNRYGSDENEDANTSSFTIERLIAQEKTSDFTALCNKDPFSKQQPCVDYLTDFKAGGSCNRVQIKTKCEDQNKNNTTNKATETASCIKTQQEDCSEKEKEKKSSILAWAAANKFLPEGAQEDAFKAALNKHKISDLGETNVAMCSGYDNSGPMSATKTFLDQLRDPNQLNIGLGANTLGQ